MKLIVIRINGDLYYSHHKSNLYPGIWYKKYKVDGSFALIYDEVIEQAQDKPAIIGKNKTLIVQVEPDIDFWNLVNSENNKCIQQLKIAI